DKFGAKSKYVQLFSRTDRIFIELISGPEEQEPVVYINNLLNDTSTAILLSSWKMNDDKIVYFYNISLLPCGYYNVVVNGRTSEIFRITDDERELSETTLIQYSMKDNKQRLDTVWWIDGMQYFFDFRIPGGFKDNGWTFGVDNEQFVTSDEDIVELFSHEYTTVLFTLGNAMGCPVWFAELLNRVLCCNYVYFDGIRYARKESNVPELNQQIEGLKSFVFNQMLQKVKTMNPVLEWNNQLAMRCVQNGVYRTVDDEGMRSIKYGSESEITEVGAYINMTKVTSNAGVSINSDTMITVNSIHHPGGDEISYWDLIAIKTTDIDNKYIDRRGYGRLTVNGLDNLKDSLDNGSINLRAVLYTGDSYTNLIEGSVISRDGVCVLKGINSRDISALKEFQLYLDNVYDCNIDNIGMTIELVWVYEND
ncbi:hypothetical protein PO254_21925, partial [Bacteroides ovatus]